MNTWQKQTFTYASVSIEQKVEDGQHYRRCTIGDVTFEVGPYSRALAAQRHIEMLIRDELDLLQAMLPYWDS